MIRTVSTPIRAALTRVRKEIEALYSSTRLSRPVSTTTIRATAGEVLDLLNDLEGAVLDDCYGMVDDSGEVWHPDDLVVLGPAAIGGAQ